MPGQLEEAFDERFAEVEAYLVFLEALEVASTAGSVRFEGQTGSLTQQQTEILKAGVFVQLYNLVEATMTRSLEALAAASVQGGWRPAHLSPSFRSEWVKVIASVNTEMNAESRLKYVVGLTDILVQAGALAPFALERGGGGNWTDIQIEKMLIRIGLRLRIPPPVRVAVKQPYRDNKGALGVVVKLRNDLAHGSISFAECGQNETVAGLRDLAVRTAMYLRTVVRAVERYIVRHEYLAAEHRPLLAELDA